MCSTTTMESGLLLVRLHTIERACARLRWFLSCDKSEFLETLLLVTAKKKPNEINICLYHVCRVVSNFAFPRWQNELQSRLWGEKERGRVHGRAVKHNHSLRLSFDWFYLEILLEKCTIVFKTYLRNYILVFLTMLRVIIGGLFTFTLHHGSS